MFRSVPLFAFIAAIAPGLSAGAAGRVVRIADALPEGYVRDGSVSYQERIQEVLDDAPAGSTIEFAPMIYAVDESGWKLKSGTTLSMRGARFRFSEKCTEDGVLFRGSDVTDVTLIGGSVRGHNALWQDGVNIRGVQIDGESSAIRIQQMRFHDLSSNGRKPNGPEKRFLWNTNITIHEVHADPTETPTQDYLVSDNLITTTRSQVAAIRVDTSAAETKNIVIRDNVLLGANRGLRIEGPDAAQVQQSGNSGAVLEKIP